MPVAVNKKVPKNPTLNRFPDMFSAMYRHNSGTGFEVYDTF